MTNWKKEFVKLNGPNINDTKNREKTGEVGFWDKEWEDEVYSRYDSEGALFYTLTQWDPRYEVGGLSKKKPEEFFPRAFTFIYTPKIGGATPSAKISRFVLTLQVDSSADLANKKASKLGFIFYGTNFEATREVMSEFNLKCNIGFQLNYEDTRSMQATTNLTDPARIERFLKVLKKLSGVDDEYIQELKHTFPVQSATAHLALQAFPPKKDPQDKPATNDDTAGTAQKRSFSQTA